MPWMETDAMSERLKFVQDDLSDRFTIAELRARYGVRRPIIHSGVIPAVVDAPNDLRTAVFKGQFRTGDHRYC